MRSVNIASDVALTAEMLSLTSTTVDDPFDASTVDASTFSPAFTSTPVTSESRYFSLTNFSVYFPGAS